MYKDAAGMAGGFSRNLMIILRDDISKRAQQKSSRDWRNFSTHIFVGCSADEAGGAAGGLILLRIEPIIRMDAASTSIILVQPPTLLGIESFIRSRSNITAKASLFLLACCGYYRLYYIVVPLE